MESRADNAMDWVAVAFLAMIVVIVLVAVLGLAYALVPPGGGLFAVALPVFGGLGVLAGRWHLRKYVVAPLIAAERKEVTRLERAVEEANHLAEWANEMREEKVNEAIQLRREIEALDQQIASEQENANLLRASVEAAEKSIEAERAVARNARELADQRCREGQAVQEQLDAVRERYTRSLGETSSAEQRAQQAEAALAKVEKTHAQALRAEKRRLAASREATNRNESKLEAVARKRDRAERSLAEARDTIKTLNARLGEANQREDNLKAEVRKRLGALQSHIKDRARHIATIDDLRREVARLGGSTTEHRQA